MQPQFINLPAKKFVGLGTRFISILSPAKNNLNLIPPLWDKLIKQIDQIPHRADKNAWGLVEPLPKTSAPTHKDEMFYIACAEVTDFAGAPMGWEDMLQRTTPAGRYACFTHQGKLDSLEKTMKHIYTAWLPASHEKLRPAPHLELYDHRFNPHSDQSEFDILLPLL